MTLLEAPELPSRLPSNSLSPDSVARLVSAATVEATLAVKLTMELGVLPVLAGVLAEVAAATVPVAEAALEALKRLDRAEAWLLLLTLPIDIMTPGRDRCNHRYRPGFEELEEDFLRLGICGNSSAREDELASFGKSLDSLQHRTRDFLLPICHGAEARL